MLNKILNSYFIFKLNKRFRIIELIKYSQNENSLSKKWLLKKVLFFKVDKRKKSSILLIQRVKDYEYTLKMFAASKVYLENHDVSIKSYNPYWMKHIGWNNPIEDKYLKFKKSNIEKIYNKLGARIIFDSESKYSNQNEIKQRLNKIKLSLKKREDIIDIEINSVVIGDLIYDTYLRYFEQKTIEEGFENNEELFLIIEISLNIFLNFEEFIKKNNIQALFTVYTSYIDHGIATRLCLQYNISVYAFGIYEDIVKKIDKETPYHSLSFWKLSKEKVLKSEHLLSAKIQLERRFEGKIDPALSYMKKSSFSSEKLNDDLKLLFSKKRNVIIYTHDFYDSPHVDRCLQMSDLYQYLKITLDNVKSDLNTNYYIKIHPNGIGDCKKKTIELVKSFRREHFHILDETVSNLNIIELKPDLIVTARGTVAMEMAYFEIPVVALYDNPYVNFDFAHTCYDLESYFSIIRGEKKTVIDFDKTKIYSYYYQAYLENLENVEISPFHLLQNYDGGKYTDQFLDHIRDHENIIFNKSFVDTYRMKFKKYD